MSEHLGGNALQGEKHWTYIRSAIFRAGDGFDYFTKLENKFLCSLHLEMKKSLMENLDFCAVLFLSIQNEPGVSWALLSNSLALQIN